MQKIHFTNKPNTDSPINANNLNLLQDNVEDAIDEGGTYEAIEVESVNTYVESVINKSYKYGKLVNLNLLIQPKNVTMGTNSYKMLSGLPSPIDEFEFFGNEYTSNGNVSQRFLIDENGDIYWWFNNQFENTTGWKIAINISYLTED